MNDENQHTKIDDQILRDFLLSGKTTLPKPHLNEGEEYDWRQESEEWKDTTC